MEAILIRRELTNVQWARIQHLIPGKEGDRGRTGEDNRLFLDAVLWILRTGAPWRDLPEPFGPWNSVFVRFNRWSKKGQKFGITFRRSERRIFHALIMLFLGACRSPASSP